jgi:fumarate hydratase subunit alpha
MREINVAKIKDAVNELCLKANFELRKDILSALKAAVKKESDERSRSILRSILENAKIARSKRIAICQDTGMVYVHLDIGQQVSFVGGSLRKAVDEGVKEAYAKGYLRKSVVADPFIRENTKTNGPAILVIDIIDGDRVSIEVSPKGFGSENKSRIKMFNPTASMDDIKAFVIDVAKQAGPGACPPLVLGVGIGGTFETAAGLAKKALLRPIDKANPKRHIARLERELVKEMNALGVGPMGLGGKTTVLGVNIIEHPVHIAGRSGAVNVSCHATRSAARTI